LYTCSEEKNLTFPYDEANETGKNDMGKPKQLRDRIPEVYLMASVIVLGIYRKLVDSDCLIDNIQ
jgi:hypothetical protein